MKFPALLLVVFVVATLAACADRASACGAVVSTEANGKTYELVIDEDAIEAAPVWNPEEGEPPLGVSQAVALGMAWARERYTRYDSVELSGITIGSYGCSLAGNGKWYYRLDLMPVIDGNRLFGGGNWVAVLMDGTVIGTTVRGEAER